MKPIIIKGEEIYGLKIVGKISEDVEITFVPEETLIKLKDLTKALLDCAWEMQRHIQLEHMDEFEYDWGDEMVRINNKLRDFGLE